MAFSFVKYKTSNAITDSSQSVDQVSPKFPISQLNKSARSYPSWLKDNATNLKQLPGIYQGVLGQVQLQSNFSNESAIKSATNNNAVRLVNNSRKCKPGEYMNSFTDTERVKQLLSMSQLPNETLATIWAHVNKTFPGRLTNREVCLALALIALFQKLYRDGQEYHQVAGQKDDPFNQVKLERKPPVPKLYPSHNDQLAMSKNNQRMTSSKSVPNELNTTNCLLVDINETDDKNVLFDAKLQASLCPFGDQLTNLKNVASNYELSKTKTSNSYNPIDLIDSDVSDKYEIFLRQSQVWLKTMTSLRTVFKRAFDILNVENSRQSALEALSSEKGVKFCKNLCLCYPIAHNINYKIDELDKKRLLECMFIDNGYTMSINNLMVSINEYWAVLINLFHETGQTKFIELIMDGLNTTNETVSSKNREELLDELDCYNKADLCAICHTKFYLVNIGDMYEKRNVSEEDLEFAFYQETVSNDGHYYYHARCANYWLNNVDMHSHKLPFFDCDIDGGILKPISS